MSVKQPRSTWTSDIEDTVGKDKFSSRLKENRDLFERLSVLLQKKNEENTRKRISTASFEKPAWSEYQADSNGYERALTEVLSLINF